VASASLTVAAPHLAPPDEPAKRLTVELRAAGLAVPRRERRLGGEPSIPFTDESAVGERSWTEIGPGTLTVRLLNPERLAGACTIDGTTYAVDFRGRRRRGRSRVVLSPPIANKLVLRCTVAGVTHELGLWFRQ
jgi:hypothetical protein